MSKVSHSHVIHTRVVEAKNLSAGGKGLHESSSHPYCKVELLPVMTEEEHTKYAKSGKLPKAITKKGSEMFQTPVIKASCHPVWNTDCSLFAYSMEQVLSVSVHSHRRIQKDTLLGRVFILMEDLLASEGNLQQWVSLCNSKGEKLPRGRIYLHLVMLELDSNPHFSLPFAETENFIAQRNAVFMEVNPHLSLERSSTSRGHGRFKSTLTNQGAGAVTGLRGEEQDLSVFVATWNVGNAPPPDDLTPWLPSEDQYDIVAIGVQECEYSRKKDMMYEPTFSSCGRDWIALLLWHFGKGYVLVTHSFLWEIKLVVFVKTSKAHLVEGVSSSTVATGIGNVLGNKGGTCVGFFFNQTSICFINAHMAAHQHMVSQRNRDSQMILSGLSPEQGDNANEIQQRFNYVFFMGDLNYRVEFGKEQEGKTPPRELFDRIVEQIYSVQNNPNALLDLFRDDQLVAQREANKAFYGWQEGPAASHRPTFKVKRGHPTAEYFEQRSPAWCDRIMWTAQPGCKIQQTMLNSCETITTSDHKPVHAAFNLTSVVLPPSTDPNRGPCTLQFKRLKCTLDSTALATEEKSKMPEFNLYIKMSSNLMNEDQGSVSTPVRKKTRSPEWNEADDIKVNLTANNIHRLRRSFIMCQCKTKFDRRDLMGGKNKNLGFTVIPFTVDSSFLKRYEVDAKVTTYAWRFESDMLMGGVKMGTLSGSCLLNWDPPQVRTSTSIAVNHRVTVTEHPRSSISQSIPEMSMSSMAEAMQEARRSEAPPPPPSGFHLTPTFTPKPVNILPSPSPSSSSPSSPAPPPEDQPPSEAKQPQPQPRMSAQRRVSTSAGGFSGKSMLPPPPPPIIDEGSDSDSDIPPPPPPAFVRPP